MIAFVGIFGESSPGFLSGANGVVVSLILSREHSQMDKQLVQ